MLSPRRWFLSPIHCPSICKCCKIKASLFLLCSNAISHSVNCEEIHSKRACRDNEMAFIIQTFPLKMHSRLFSRVSKKRQLLGEHDQHVYWYPGVILSTNDGKQKCRDLVFWNVWFLEDFKMTMPELSNYSRKTCGWRTWVEYLAHSSPWSSHSRTCTASRQSSYTDMYSDLLVAFGKQYFLDSICKSCFVFLLQNNLHCEILPYVKVGLIIFLGGGRHGRRL